MKRIRIGNDVIVRTSLDEFETNDKLKIKTLQCLFIKQKHNDKSDNDMCYEPSQYVYGCCGCCNYNAAVFNNGYNMPCTLRDPHWFPGYNGFGVNSNKFNCPKEYQSDVRVFDNYVESYFPAKDQKLGIFKVVFVAQVYTTGWGMNDLKTITIDKGELFALVDSSEESTTDGLIDLTDSQDDDKLTVDAVEILRSTVHNNYFKGNSAVSTYELFDFTSKDFRWIVYYIKDNVRYYITKDNAKYFNFSITQDGKPAKSTIDEFGTISYVKESAYHNNSEKDDIIINVASKYNENIVDYLRCSLLIWNKPDTNRYCANREKSYYISFKEIYKGPDNTSEESYNIFGKKYTKINLDNITNGLVYYIKYSGISSVDKYYAKKYLTLDSSNHNAAITDEFCNIIIIGKGDTKLTLKDKITNDILTYIDISVN